jgi:hypothetical protein
MFVVTSLGACAASCAATCACAACRGVASGISRRSARLAYCGIFLLAMLLAWLLRDFAEPLLDHIPCEFSLADVFYCLCYCQPDGVSLFQCGGKRGI